MENNSTKVEMMKPVFLKAGIPIAITLAGYIIAKISTRKTIQENVHDDDDHEVIGNYQNLENYDDDHCSTNTLYRDSLESFDLYQENPHCSTDSGEARNFVREDIMAKYQENPHEVSRNDHCSTTSSGEARNFVREDIMAKYQEYQENPHEVSRNDHCSTNSGEARNFVRGDIMAKFEEYTHLKEKEIELMDMENKLLLEINRVEFFVKEIKLMEVENQRFQDMVIEYLRILELVDLSKSENTLLQQRVKKLLKKVKGSSRVIEEQRSQLEAKEIEISRNREGIEMKDHVIKKMELEIEQLQMEKDELMSKLELVETSNQSKNEVEVVTIEDYKELANELEELQKDKASEDKELIHLRWSNACLRHKLMRRNQEQMEQRGNQEQENREIHEEFVPKVHEIIMRRSSSVGHSTESCLTSPINGSGHSNDHSKRRKLMQKFKKWVEGSDKMKHETNCFRRHSVSDHTEDLILIPARKSCSSA